MGSPRTRRRRRRVARIYAAKGRPSFNPLIAHVADVAMAERFAEAGRGRGAARGAVLAGAADDGGSDPGRRSRRPFMPGSRRSPCGARRGRWASLRARLGRPLAAPSANPSGRLSPTTARHVVDGLGDSVDLVLDGGPCATGLESTIVSLEGPSVLRAGAIGEDALAEVLGHALVSRSGGRIEAPGMMASHYAPDARVRLDATARQPGELLLGFGAVEGDLNLSPSGDLAEAARRLYAALAELDQRTDRIAVAPIPHKGIGIAINDRLRRAATP